jgi:hypothetical protein
MVRAQGSSGARRAAGTMLLAGSLVASLAWHRTPAPIKGVAFTFTMTMRPPAVGTRPVRQTVIIGTGRFANDRGRIDFDSTSGLTSFSKGDYFLVDSGRTYLVRPSVQTYSEIDSPILNPFRNLASQLNNASLSNVKVEMEKAPLDTLVGLPAQGYKIMAEYLMDLGPSDASSHTTTELWIAKLPFRFVNPVDETLRSPRLPRLLRPVFDKIAEYSVQISKEGTTVKSVTTTTINIVGGATYDLVQTFEMKSVKETDVDEGSLRIPDRFRKGGGP